MEIPHLSFDASMGFSLAGTHNLNQELVEAVRNELQHAKSVIIGTHLNPDGDALGSALAVSHFLDGLGIENEVLCHHPAPRNLRFLPGISRLKTVPTRTQFDLAIVVDLDAFDRLGRTEPFFQNCPKTILIDHHIPHEKPGDLRIIDSDAPATALILTRLFLALKVKMTSDIATCLYTGIVTDTGSFRFRNTTPESLAISSLLLDCGANLEAVSENIFQSRPESGARLLGHVLGNMHLEYDKRIAWSIIKCEDFERFQGKDEDTEGFVNELLSVDTVLVAALGRETKPGLLRVSLRSRGNIDVAEISRPFGGGGHLNAAGLTFEQDPETSMTLLVQKVKEGIAKRIE